MDVAKKASTPAMGKFDPKEFFETADVLSSIVAACDYVTLLRLKKTSRRLKREAEQHWEMGYARLVASSGLATKFHLQGEWFHLMGGWLSDEDEKVIALGAMILRMQRPLVVCRRTWITEKGIVRLLDILKEAPCRIFLDFSNNSIGDCHPIKVHPLVMQKRVKVMLCDSRCRRANCFHGCDRTSFSTTSRLCKWLETGE